MKPIRVLTATDLHQIKWVYRALEEAVAEHKPDLLALVGDFLHGGVPRSGHYSARECAGRLAALPCEVVFARGNHEMDNWEPFAKRWLQSGRPLHIPHGDAVTFGPLVVVGFPCSFAHEEYFLMGRPNNTFATDEWLPRIWDRYGPAALTLWLMHEPPARTKLCDEEGMMAGLEEWREAIEKYQPWLTVSGHDHETPVFNGSWRDRIGRTTCINTGQPTRLTEPTRTLHYGVLDFEFAGHEPALPKGVKVTAHPWRETLTLPHPGKI
jgi:Icc-related predicted phosphoesterase